MLRAVSRQTTWKQNNILLALAKIEGVPQIHFIFKTLVIQDLDSPVLDWIPLYKNIY